MKEIYVGYKSGSAIFLYERWGGQISIEGGIIVDEGAIVEGYDTASPEMKEMALAVIPFLPKIEGYRSRVHHEMLSAFVLDQTFDAGIEEFHYNKVPPTQEHIAEMMWQVALLAKGTPQEKGLPKLLEARNEMLNIGL